MGVNLKLTDDAKKHMSNLAFEAKVLNNLLGERRAMMEGKAREILETNGFSPSLYAMHFSVAEDKWEAVLKPGSLSIPENGIKPARVIRN